MNHRLRARGIVTRSFPETIALKGRPNIRVDMRGWHNTVAADLQRGLEDAEREGHRVGVYSATNTAAALLQKGAGVQQVIDALLQLQKDFDEQFRQRRRRARRG